jgi:hypothetical protein
LYLKWVGWAKQSHGSVQKLLVKRKRRVGWGSISGTWCMQVCNHQPALVCRQKVLCWIMKFVGAVTYSEWVRNPASEQSNSPLSHYCNYMHGLRMQCPPVACWIPNWWISQEFHKQINCCQYS